MYIDENFDENISGLFIAMQTMQILLGQAALQVNLYVIVLDRIMLLVWFIAKVGIYNQVLC